MLAADAAVMCTCDLWRRSLFELAVILARFQRGAVHAFIGNLIEPVGQSLGEAARVGEHDRRAVLLDEIDDSFLDGGPDALSHFNGRWVSA